MIIAVLFDLDQTLLDHNTTIDEASCALFQKIRPDSSTQEQQQFVNLWHTVNEKWYQKFYAHEISFQDSCREKLREAFHPYGVLFSDEKADIFFSGYVAQYIASCRPFEDVADCLCQLTSYRVGILTNGQTAHYHVNSF